MKTQGNKVRVAETEYNFRTVGHFSVWIIVSRSVKVNCPPGLDSASGLTNPNMKEPYSNASYEAIVPHSCIITDSGIGSAHNPSNGSRELSPTD